MKETHCMPGPHSVWIGKQRPNPNMKQLVERIVAKPGADGRFMMRVDPPEALERIAP